ncbi:hypothetical protein CI238_04221 [Colletotrichum incanum]|uniref:Uncharacterized protein n=1 Tax=Colletotrichum incanum TaxID=1573173 RepID=A0A161YAF7_COLIC|nr:hypothetical protein CI238_04221 [Colletotrichum incanum]
MATAVHSASLGRLLPGPSQGVPICGEAQLRSINSPSIPSPIPSQKDNREKKREGSTTCCAPHPFLSSTINPRPSTLDPSTLTLRLSTLGRPYSWQAHQRKTPQHPSRTQRHTLDPAFYEGYSTVPQGILQQHRRHSIQLPILVLERPISMATN